MKKTLIQQAEELATITQGKVLFVCPSYAVSEWQLINDGKPKGFDVLPKTVKNRSPDL